MRTIWLGNGKQRVEYMHRFILGITDPKIKVDHINHNELDNGKCNLRACQHKQNMRNVLKCKRQTSSMYKGVYWHKMGKKWMGYISYEGKRIHLGLFTNEGDAARAYNERASELYGEFARFNEVA